jgi:hypothetical protein
VPALRKLWNKIDARRLLEERRASAMEATLSNRTPDASPEAIVRIRLQRMIGLLCEDAARVELWAGALSGFARPIPDHDDWRVKHRIERN